MGEKLGSLIETLSMSSKERKRMVILAEVKKGRTSMAQAGRVMGVCYGQAKRIWKRFKQAGEADLGIGAGVGLEAGETYSPECEFLPPPQS